MKQILKYQLEELDEQQLLLPKNSRILSVERQFQRIVLYAIVDVEETLKDDYTIIIHGTGHPANDVDDFIFLGTVKLDSGQLIYHVFYKLQ